MRKIILFAVLAAALLVTGGGVLYAQRGTQAETLEVKIASPLPRDSLWGRTLDRLAADWNRITNGQVRPRVLHGGTEGGESKMHLSLASNTIQAAVFTSFGLSYIAPSVLTMSTPFLVRNEAELNAVMNEVQGDLEAMLNSGDYFIVAWSRAGFVNIFSRDPVFTPDDLKKIRIASNSEAEDMNNSFRSMGFQIVETDWTDVGPKLNAGTITAVYQTSAAVAATQIHRNLRNMLSVNIAPVLGGIIINQVTWRRIGTLNPRYQQELLRSARQIAQGLDESMQKTEADAIASMTRDGLRVNRPNTAQEQLWQNEIEKVMPSLLENTYDRQLLQKINNILARHRGGR
jgi:TRAP-type C4-dicarboxylate transport system substrate-binding protein